MIDWNIQSRAHACQACHRHFADHESFHTLLYDQKHSYERLDVCDACWKTQLSEGGTDRKGFVSHWTGVYAVPPAAPPEPIGRENAESLLRKLIEQNDPTHAGARFILAVMLERKRLLKVKAQVTEGGRRVFIYEHGKSGDLFNIPDPNLQLDQLEEVQRDVAHLLEHGLESCPPESARPMSPGSEVTLPQSAESNGTPEPLNATESVEIPAASEPSDDPAPAALR